MNAFFLHLSKTGGTTIQHTLMDNYYIVTSFPTWQPWKVQLPECNDNIVFSGHTTYTAKNLIDPNMYTFTVLRNPLARTVSNWKNLVRDKSVTSHELDEYLDLSFSEFIRVPAVRNTFSNMQTKQLGIDFDYNYLKRLIKRKKVTDTQAALAVQQAWDLCDCTTLSRAMSVLETIDFCFTENLRASITPISHVLNMKGFKTASPKRVSPIEQNFKLSKDDIKYIENDLCFYDCALYEFACRLYERKYKYDTHITACTSTPSILHRDAHG